VVFIQEMLESIIRKRRLRWFGRIQSLPHTSDTRMDAITVTE